MKSKLILACLSGLALLAPQPVEADTVAGSPGAHVQMVSSKVGRALSNIHFVNGNRPNVGARYYIYLSTAGWCGPCCKAMPQVVKAYEEMKNEGIAELLVVDYDHNEEDARKYLSRNHAQFAGVMKAQGAQLPGYKQPRGIPQAIIVDAEGNVIKEGHGTISLDYRNIISEYEKAKGLPLSFPR